MRWLAAFALGLAVGSAVMPAVAQTIPPAPQILTLDQDRLYTDSLYGKAMEGRALTAGLALATENRKIEADLAAEEADLTQKRAATDPAAFQKLADAFDAKVEKFRADQAAKALALKAQNEADRKTFFQAAIPVLADLMRQMGAYAILNHDAVVLAFDAIDVTKGAIKALDTKLGDGSAVPQGPRLQPSKDGTAAPTQPAPDQPVPSQPAPAEPAPTKPAEIPTVPAPTAP